MFEFQNNLKAPNPRFVLLLAVFEALVIERQRLLCRHRYFPERKHLRTRRLTLLLVLVRVTDKVPRLVIASAFGVEVAPGARIANVVEIAGVPVVDIVAVRSTLP